VFHTWKNESRISSRFIFFVVGTLAIAIPATLLSLSLERAYQDSFFPHLQQQQAVYEALSNKEKILLESYRDSLNYSRMEELHDRTSGLINLIGAIKIKMVQESESKPGIKASGNEQVMQSEFGPAIQFVKLSVPFHPAPARDFLSPGCSSRSQLDSALLDYGKYLASFVQSTSLQNYAGLRELSSYLPVDENSAGRLSLMTGLHTLALLQNSLLVTEIGLLKETAIQNTAK
jgi:hypothetical protein